MATTAISTSKPGIAVLASAARTTAQTSNDLKLPKSASGVRVVFDVTAGTGLGLTLTIKGKDPASGKYYTLLAGASVTGVSTNVYQVGVGYPVTTNVSANAGIPQILQITVAVADATSATYSVGLETIY